MKRHKRNRIVLGVFIVLLIASIVPTTIFVGNQIIEYGRLNRFVPGLHEPRTGDEVESIFDFAGPEVEILFETYFWSSCKACQDYSVAQQQALEGINSGELAGKVAFVSVNVAQETDRAVRDYGNKFRLTFPVLAGATEVEIEGKGIRATPTTFIWIMQDGEWKQFDSFEGLPGNEERQITPKEAIILMARLVYDNVLHPQIHDVRTEERGETVLDFVPETAQLVMAFFVNPECARCGEQANEAAMAIGDMKDLGIDNKIAVVFIGIGPLPEEELAAFAEEHKLPDSVPVLTQANPSTHGLPEDIDWAAPAARNYQTVPATLMIYEGLEGWVSLGFQEGVLPSYGFISLSFNYLSWRAGAGF